MKTTVTVLRYFFTGMFLFLIAPSISAQTYTGVFIEGNSYQILGSSFSDTSNGTIVGMLSSTNMLIYRTTNGGASWINQNPGLAGILLDVSFPDSSNGTAVGYSGKLLRTTNAGATWTSSSAAGTNHLYSVSFTDANHGTAVGDSATNQPYIFRTTNGGTDWVRQTAPGGVANLRGVCFTDTNNGIAVGVSGKIIRTTDGGTTWTSVTSPVGTSLFSVDFPDANNGWAVGASGVIIRTTDGGATWSSQSSNLTSGYTLNDVSFSSTTHGTAVGNGPILRTNDGGVNWFLHQPAYNTTNYTAAFFTANKGIVAGFGNTVNRTTNAATMSAPVITGGSAANISTSTAILEGHVNAKGAVSSVRFLIGTSSGVYTDSVTAGPITFYPNSYFQTYIPYGMTGLLPSTTYYVRLAAETFIGYTRGSQFSFKTLTPVPATVTAGSTSGIGYVGATMNGTINTHGLATTIRFLYGTSPGVYTDSVFADQSPLTDSTSNAISASLSGLDTNTTYYYCVSAANSFYYARSSETNFTTLTLRAAAVAMNAATGVVHGSATVNGTINTHGLYTVVRFLRGTVSGVYTDSVLAVESPVTDSTVTAMSAVMNGLMPNQKYYVRLTATNPNFYSKSAESDFTTAQVLAPSVSTLAATSVGSTTATPNATVNPFNLVTTVRFLRGTSPGVYTDSVVAQQSPVNGGSSVSLSGSFTGLAPNTTYYVKVSAKNDSFYTRGNEMSFTTYVGASSLSGINIVPNYNYIDVPYDEELNPATNFTVEFWARPQGGDGDYRCVLGTEDGSIYSGYYFYNTWDNTWQCWIGDGVNWHIIQGPAVSNGVWDHLVLTYSTDEAKFYVNGVLYGSASLTYNVNTTMPFRIGGLAEAVDLYMWNGDIDEVRLWSVVRSEQQIRENMHRNLTGSTTDMIAYFPLNEGTGTTTASLTGGFTATLEGSPTWIASSIPLGIGTSVTATDFSTGTASLGAISVTMTDDMDNSVMLTGTTLSAAPNSLPSGFSAILGNKYFILGLFGDGGTYTADLSLTLGSGVLPSQANDYPAAVKLYGRSNNGSGEWTLIGGAMSANSTTGVVTWSGVTGFGQYCAVIQAVPTVANVAPTSVTAHTATLNGNVNAHGFSTTVKFLYGTSAGVYSDSATAIQSPLSGTSSSAVSYALYGLSANSTYYGRIAAANDYVYLRSDEFSFTTAQPESAGYALTFDGVDDHVTIADAPSLDITTAITLEAWVKFNAIGHRWIVGKDPYNTAYQLFADTYFGNKFYFQINSDGQVEGGTPTVGVWTHVAGTYDGANLKLYVNGELIATTAYTNAITPTSEPLKVGAFNYLGTPWYPFDGSIEEVRIWNVARTQKEIRENMHRVQSTPGNLVAYFKFNEGTGSTTTGTFGAYTASLVNDPAWTVSTAPFGTGTSSSTASAITEGTANLGSASVTLSESFDNAVHLTSTEIYVKPYSLPVGYTSAIANKYFIINAFGTPGTFSANITVNYGPGVLDSRVTAFPGGMKLYKRSTFGDGAWTLVGGAASASASTGVVTWNGVTSFSQFAAVYEESALPVELVSFTGTAARLNAQLQWETATEVNNYGFEIERSAERSRNTTDAGVSTSLNVQWMKIGFVEGNGTSNSTNVYSFVDKNLKAGKYSYRLKQIDRDGNFGYSQSVEVEVGNVPKIFALEQNYPNPFNPSTTIGFTLQESGLTSLKIYDAIGREVKTLVNENLEAGVYHQKIFNASNLSSGIYFARLTSSGKTQLKKLVLMK